MASKFDISSNGEKIIGYLDGQAIYQKCYVDTNKNLSSSTTIDSSLNASEIKHLLKLQGSAKNSNGEFIFQAEEYNTGASKNYCAYFKITNSGVQLTIANYTINSYCLILEYVKA